jgi:uncharacterized membrane protein YbhN (UPF0104 family)
MIDTYFASLLAATVIPVFGGAGAVEAVSVIALEQAGIRSEFALGAVVLWRLIDLWIPVGIGLALHAITELPTGNGNSETSGEISEAVETPALSQ